ncbi:PA14 domain-containing protein [Shimia sp. SDUM112013]|uniref:PA14 domain-containing protein n=1 Tax=Shimia sp. SDUM112013 TaxID=3136160 RepID=UPI0032EB89FF
MILRAIATLAMLFALTGTVSAQQIDPTKLKQGFVMKFYPIIDPTKPDVPKGRAIASLVYNDGFPVSYFKPFDMQPALKKYQDKWWLLEFDGYLNLTDNGDYTFATTLSTGKEWATCGSELFLNGVSINKVAHKQHEGNRNAYKDIPLAAGLYPIKIKFFCTDRRHTNVPQFELAVRGPRDPMALPFAARNVFHLVE